jgi:hypothetical protein
VLIKGLSSSAGKENAIGDVARKVCGSSGVDVCANRKGKWLGERSPFAYGPKYMAKDHDEL